jgi:hypothetical protein
VATPGVCLRARVRGGTPLRIHNAYLPLLRLWIRAEEYLQGLFGVVAPLQQVQPVVSQERVGPRLGRNCPYSGAGVGDEDPYRREPGATMENVLRVSGVVGNICGLSIFGCLRFLATGARARVGLPARACLHRAWWSGS